MKGRRLWIVCTLGLGLAAGGGIGELHRASGQGAAPATRADGAVSETRPLEEWERQVVDNAEPVVIKTVPEAGATNVDPNLKEIRVTFNKDMRNGSWSWVQRSAYLFPKAGGRIHYLEDKRTCVMPVHLEPGHGYMVWLNTDRFVNFKDAQGRSAVPYMLVFETAKGP